MLKTTRTATPPIAIPTTVAVDIPDELDGDDEDGVVDVVVVGVVDDGVVVEDDGGGGE